MNDVTPDLIAQIASRLYNEVPGAGSVPRSPNDFGTIPSLPVEAPTLPAMAELRPGGMNSPTSSTTPEGVAGVISRAAQNVQSSATNTSPPITSPASLPGFSSSGGDAHPLSTVRAQPTSTDGLRAFVEQINTSHVHSEAGLCAGNNGLPKNSQSLWASKATGLAHSRPLDVPAIRRDFPILNQRIHGKPLAWFDNAATTQKPQSVIDAISRFYANDNSNIHRGAHTLAARATDAFEQARQKVQTFLGASSSKEIIFVRGTTEGINLIAKTYGRKFLQPGDEIVLSTLEHHANIVPWQMVAKETGAVIRVIPVTDRGEIMMEQYQSLLGSRTKIVSLAHASNALGTLLPVHEMTQMAKRYNARVLIDGAQSVAHVPVNMQQLGADFYVFSGHKIFGPTGIGAVYAKEEVQEIMPPWQGGGNMIKNVTFEETTYSPPPAKFEAGTPNIADAVGLGAALDYVNRLGLPNIGKYEHQLLEYATEQLSRIDGVRLIGTAREKVGVLSFVLPERRTEDVGRALDQEGIAVRAGHHCAQPSLRRYGVEQTVRPSFSFYNTFEEIDRLADAVRRIQRQ